MKGDSKMVWTAVIMIALSFIVTMIIKRKTAPAKQECEKHKIDKLSPLIGLSTILVGTTIMIGYILVTYLGKLGTYLADSIRILIG